MGYFYFVYVCMYVLFIRPLTLQTLCTYKNCDKMALDNNNKACMFWEDLYTYACTHKNRDKMGLDNNSA